MADGAEKNDSSSIGEGLPIEALSSEELTQEYLADGKNQLDNFKGDYKDRAEEEYEELVSKIQEDKGLVTENVKLGLNDLKQELKKDLQEFTNDLTGLEAVEQFNSTEISDETIDGKNHLAIFKEHLKKGRFGDVIEEKIYDIFNNKKTLNSFLSQYKKEIDKGFTFPVNDGEAEKFIQFYNGGEIKQENSSKTEDLNSTHEKGADNNENINIFQKFETLETELSDDEIFDKMSEEDFLSKIKEFESIVQTLIKNKTFTRDKKLSRIKILKKVQKQTEIYKKSKKDKEEIEKQMDDDRETIDKKYNQAKIWEDNLSKLNTLGIPTGDDKLFIRQMKGKMVDLNSKISKLSTSTLSTDGKDKKEKYIEIKRGFNSIENKLDAKFNEDTIKGYLVKAQEKDREKNEKGAKDISKVNEKVVRSSNSPEETLKAVSKSASNTINYRNSSVNNDVYKKVYGVFDGGLTTQVQKRLLNMRGRGEIPSPSPTPNPPSLSVLIAKKALGKDTKIDSKDGGVINKDGTMKMIHGKDGKLQVFSRDPKTGGTFPIEINVDSSAAKSAKNTYFTESKDAQIIIETSHDKIITLEEKLKTLKSSSTEAQTLRVEIQMMKDEIQKQREIQLKAKEKFNKTIDKEVQDAVEKVERKNKNVNRVLQQTGFYLFPEDAREQILKMIGDPLVTINLTTRLNAATIDFSEGLFGGSLVVNGNPNTQEQVGVFTTFMRKLVTGNEEGSIDGIEGKFITGTLIGDIDSSNFSFGNANVEYLKWQMDKTGVMSTAGVVDFAKLKENLAKPVMSDNKEV